MPIEIEFTTGSTAYRDLEPRRNFYKMNSEAAADRAKWLLPLAGAEQATREQIDNYAEYLVGFIQTLISQTVPYKQARTQFSKPWWNTEVADVVVEERRARRAWTRTHTDQAWEEFKAATNAKRQRIASAKQAHWRRSVHEASISKEGIWKLAKWARTKSYLPPEPPQIPNIQWQGAVYTATEDKARALCKRFYPAVEADIEDITD